MQRDPIGYGERRRGKRGIYGDGPSFHGRSVYYNYTRYIHAMPRRNPSDLSNTPSSVDPHGLPRYTTFDVISKKELHYLLSRAVPGRQIISNCSREGSGGNGGWPAGSDTRRPPRQCHPEAAGTGRPGASRAPGMVTRSSVWKRMGSMMCQRYRPNRCCELYKPSGRMTWGRPA